MAMQGSCISNVDVGSATIKLSEDGTYNLIIGAADMGTGCDTILAQMAAECMDCSVEDVAVFGADTDSSPYDSGSYASSTTYLTGKAVEKACEELKEKIRSIGAELLHCSPGDTVFEGKRVRRPDTGESVTLEEIGYKTQVSSTKAAESTTSHSSPISPPPFMVGMVEIELDKETGLVTILDYMAVVDCGIPSIPPWPGFRQRAASSRASGIRLRRTSATITGAAPSVLPLCSIKSPPAWIWETLRVELSTAASLPAPSAPNPSGKS